MKPLDFVRTPKGGIAIVTEVSDRGNASISFLGGGNPTNEHNAWWAKGDGLVVIDSLPWLLARGLAHPFGDGKKAAHRYFGVSNAEA